VVCPCIGRLRQRVRIPSHARPPFYNLFFVCLCSSSTAAFFSLVAPSRPWPHRSVAVTSSSCVTKFLQNYPFSENGRKFIFLLKSYLLIHNSVLKVFYMFFDQKNMLNMNMAFIHLFASCIMTRVDSCAGSPHIYAEYFGFPTMVSPLRLILK
jgi:hypothetical protein